MTEPIRENETLTESLLEIVASLRTQLREANELAAMRTKANKLYARDNERLWAAHHRMSSTLERIEKRRVARRASRSAAVRSPSPGGDE